MTDMMALRMAICMALLMGLLMVVLKLLIWRRNPETRPCKWFGHDKKYVALALKGCVPLGGPESSGRKFPCDHKHQIGEKDIYVARWACRRCPKMGEDCLGKDQDWTIQHEKLVPDVKKWANWSQDPPPPAEANKTAREKLAEIQKRLEEVKYCGNCGTTHAGPCCKSLIK